ncbi:MAG TPA: YidC/Oxa1 family membrane protein insertase [Candidatus Saccharimonadales bacterium]
MFTTIIVQPIFNLLVLIYAALPGHNFGLAIIIFTIVIRMLLWPFLKKQLHQTKVMREVQPEMKKIKAAAKGNKQKESQMMMELYRERGINPFGSIGVLLLQLPILIGLYSGLHRVVTNPHAMVTFAYPGLQHLSWMKELAAHISRFDNTLFGFVNLTRSAIGPHGTYWPAMIIVLLSATVQYFQSNQLMPKDPDARKLRDVLKSSNAGGAADQAEVNAAINRSTRFILPAMIFLFTVNLPSALSLYWLVGGLVAFVQQSYALREDTTEMEAEVDGEKVTAEVISKAKPAKAGAKTKTSAGKSASAKKPSTAKPKQRKKQRR